MKVGNKVLGLAIGQKSILLAEVVSNNTNAARENSANMKEFSESMRQFSNVVQRFNIH